MKAAVIHCEALSRHLEEIAEIFPYNTYVWRQLPAHLHNNPGLLNTRLQAEIDRLDTEKDLEAIVLGFGICAGSTLGLQSRHLPLIIPRVQDCIGMFLGSHSQYLETLTCFPDISCMSRGLYKTVVSNIPTAPETRNCARDHSLTEEDFDRLKTEYGQEHACLISHLAKTSAQLPQRVAYIRFPEEPEYSEELEVTRATASYLNLECEVINGDASLFQAMLSGDWHDPRLLEVPPQHRTEASPGEQLIAFTSGLDSDLETLLEKYQQQGRNRRDNVFRSGLALGIDTGGTFTDGVIYDFDNAEVLASAKTRTRHENLAEGIHETLAELPFEKLGKIQRVGISTTLATNAFIEDKGAPVGLLIMGPGMPDRDTLPFRSVYQLAGSMKISGEEEMPVQEEEVRSAAEKASAAGCTAIAVSGYGSVINPAHEQQVARIAYEASGLRTVCGHELTTELNFVERMTTAAMNARLIPLVEDLLDAIKDTLRDHGIKNVPVMVVKGDGSQISEQVARKYPVETILSGPAASVVGAGTLFDIPDAVVVDTGGTSTDVAMTQDYMPVRSDRGAQVGQFQTSIRAMDIRTTGLGGDSEIDLSDWPRVKIGPRRIIPISQLSSRDSDATAYLRRHLHDDFFPERHGLELIERLPGKDSRGWLDHYLNDGPRLISEIAQTAGRLRTAYLDWEQWENSGHIIRHGLTLTDIMHVQNKYTPHDQDLAEEVLNTWATALGVTQQEIVSAIHHEFRAMVVDKIVAMTSPAPCPWEEQPDSALHYWLTRHITDDSTPDEGGFAFRLRSALIPVGAPTPALFPQLSAFLTQEVFISQWASVANAVGAAAGDIVLQDTATVKVSADGGLVCSWRGGSFFATNMKEALETCEHALRDLLYKEAEGNEIPFCEPFFNVIPHEGDSRDGKVLLGVTCTAELRG